MATPLPKSSTGPQSHTLMAQAWTALYPLTQPRPLFFGLRLGACWHPGHELTHKLPRATRATPTIAFADTRWRQLTGTLVCTHHDRHTSWPYIVTWKRLTVVSHPGINYTVSRALTARPHPPASCFINIVEHNRRDLCSPHSERVFVTKNFSVNPSCNNYNLKLGPA